MKTNSSVRLSALAVMLVLVVMLCSMFSVAYAEKVPVQGINLLEAEDGNYQIIFDKSGMDLGGKFFEKVAIVEKSKGKYILKLIQPEARQKMTMAIKNGKKDIDAVYDVNKKDDCVYYTFKNVPEEYFLDVMSFGGFVARMGMPVNFDIVIDPYVATPLGDKINDNLVVTPAKELDVEAPFKFPLWATILIVVVVVAIIATIVIVVVKKSKKKKAINAVVEDAKSEPVAEPVVEEAPAVEEVTEDASTDNKKEN